MKIEIKKKYKDYFCCLLAAVAVLYFYFSYEEYWLDLFQTNVLCYLEWKQNVGSSIIGVMLVVASLFTMYQLKKQYYRCSVRFLTVSLIYLIGYVRFRFLQSSPFDVIPCVGSVSYFDILSMHVVGMFVVSIITRMSTEDNENKNEPFMSIVKQEELKDVGWNAQIKTVVGKIRATKVETGCFSLGIASPWGSGKTTFLLKIEEYLKQEKCIVIRFDPWQCLSHDQIVNDFFNALNATFKRNRRLIKQIKKYSRFLTSINKNPGVIESLLSLFDVEEIADIKGMKRKVEEELDKINRQIFVLIDDLDRLDQKELWETLRLIRITADFRNLIFISAYDKQYVSSKLGGNQEFIKKIFNVEMSLPAFEDYKLLKILYDSISKVLKDDIDKHDAKQAILRTNDEGRFIILRYINTFRDVVRFSNILSLNIELLYATNTYKQVVLQDFIYVELLHYVNDVIYNDLYFNSLKYLREQNERYLLVDKNEDNNLDKNVPVFDIFKILFNVNNKNPKSICFAESFDIYFSYRIFDNKIGYEQYRENLNVSEEELKGVFVNVFKRYRGVRNVMSYTKSHHEFSSKIEVENYLRVTLMFCDLCEKGTLNTYYKDVWKKDKFSNIYEGNENLLSSFLCDEIKKMVEQTKTPVNWSLLFSFLAQTCWFDDEEILEYKTVLKKADIKQIIFCIYERYVTINGKPSFLDLFEENNPHFLFIKTCRIKCRILERDEGQFFMQPLKDLWCNELSSDVTTEGIEKLYEEITSFEWGENTSGIDEYVFRNEQLDKIEVLFQSKQNFLDFIKEKGCLDETYKKYEQAINDMENARSYLLD